MFEIKLAADKQYYFILKAKNGEVIVTSEMYTTKAMCKKGIKSVRWNALLAPIVDMS